MTKVKEEELLRLQSMWEIEHSLFDKGYVNIAGVDEAGRGPLADEVYAAAVILPNGLEIEGLNDSKKLSEKMEGDCICDFVGPLGCPSELVEEDKETLKNKKSKEENFKLMLDFPFLQI